MKLKLMLFSIMVVSGLFQLMTPSKSGASSPDWINSTVQAEFRGGPGDDAETYGRHGQCSDRIVSLPNSWGYYQEMTACVFQAKSYMYAIHNGSLFLNLSGGSTMYPLSDYGFGDTYNVNPSPYSDDFIFGSMVFNDLPNNIESNNDANRPAYIPSPLARYEFSIDQNNARHSVSTASVSKNGKWAILNFADIGYVRVNINDKNVKWVAPNRKINEFTTISDDGRYFVSASFGYEGLQIYDMQNCGVDAEKLMSEWFTDELITDCRYRDLSVEINQLLDSDLFTSPAKPEFNADDTELFVYTRPNNAEGKGVVLRINETQDIAKLDYLALGDSYSSGEGDVDRMANGEAFYLSGTAGAGGCHVSSQSFPFLLADVNGVEANRFKSVACSGARVAHDYYGANDNYMGQRGQLKGKLESEAAIDRANALSTFTPGVLKQVEFVRENKPKVITLTGGGNDVGFSKLLTYCALPSGVGDRSNTCDQAVANTLQRSMLGDSIRGQYDKIVALVQAVKMASPSTTVYVVGYPSFASEGAASCLNAGMLNQAERSTINSSVNYLNLVLHNASKFAGAHYIDIESSLVGGRICEGSEYITGPLGVLGFDIFDRKSEMFHPNSEGHAKMAESIMESGFKLVADANPVAQAVSAPAKPATFGSSAYVPTFEEKLVTDGVIEVGKNIQLSLSPGLYAANKLVSFTVWSKPEKLGGYKTSSTGALSQFVKITKSIEPGYHMLVAEGESATGGMLRTYQFIEVQSGKLNDRDGDGIKDDRDTCQYMQRWYDEDSKKDICKQSTGHGNGNGGHGNGHAHGHTKHNWVLTMLRKYNWNFTLHSGTIGAFLCIGLFGLRFR